MSRNSSQYTGIEKRASRTGLLLILVAALTLEATSLIQSYFSQKGLREEADHRAEAQLDITRNMIMNVINQTETAVRNSFWIAQWCLDYQDSLVRVSERLVRDNPTVIGSTVALVPGYSRQHRLFSPYVHISGDSLSFQSLATPEYDYPSQEWFVKPLELDAPYWSEPYLDEGGGEVLMTTYSVPVHDLSGRQAAVLTGDLALDWLADLMEEIRIYPHITSLMLSRTGQLMVSRGSGHELRESLIAVVEELRDDADFQELERAMGAGESGDVTIRYNRQKSHIYFAPVERTGWYMCIMIPDDDIYGSIRRIDAIVKVLQLLGLILLILILRALFKSQLQYRDLDQRRERMQGELRVASNIQMSMVPKEFPPFPERNDLDMAAVIVPAREVGGDLYDFYIRDEKLFFCIGDVSGKGVPASLVMAVTRTTFRTVSAHEDSPGVIVSVMNKTLSDMNEQDMFVTFFCGVLDLEAGRLGFCNAGHNPPRILTDAIRTLEVKPNLPLGVMPDWPFEEQQTPFGYDSAILLYTDGLTEAENAAHEQYGERRLDRILHGREGAYVHLKRIEADVKEFVGDAPQSDDLTMLLVHYLGGEADLRGNKLVMHNDIKQVSRLEGWLKSLGKKFSLKASLLPELNLALEEAVTNVILYAYPEGSYGSVELSAACSYGVLIFVLTDSGQPFDPTAAPEADTHSSLQDRPVGGLGIHILRQIMDSVQYERRGGKNILTMTKNI